MVLECLDYRTEIGVAQLSDFLIPFIHLLHGFGRCRLGVEYLAETHRQVIGIPEAGIMPEQYVCPMTLYVSSFV